MDQETYRRAGRLSPADRRAQLLTIAIRVFAAEGLGQGRHARVAAVAHVSVPTVFVYFPTRAALVQAVLEEVDRFIVEDVVRPVVARRGPVPALLYDIAAAFAASIDTHPDHARVWLDWSTAIREDVWPRYLQFQERVFEMLKPTFERGVRDGSLHAELDCDDAVRVLVGSAHMIAQMKFTGREGAKIMHFVQTVIDGYRARAGERRRLPDRPLHRGQDECGGERQGEP